MAAMTVTIHAALRVPGGNLLVTGAINGHAFDLLLNGAAFDALPNLGAKRQFVGAALRDWKAARDAASEPGLPGTYGVP